MNKQAFKNRREQHRVLVKVQRYMKNFEKKNPEQLEFILMYKSIGINLFM